MVAATQLRLALEAEDERSAKTWNRLDLDFIWISFGLRLEFSKISRNVLARPVIGTIFLVYVCLSWSKKRRRNYVGQMRACSKSVLGSKIRPVTPVLFILTIR